uniref:Uncharacterized protein n=1 Tax=Agrobacterium tumefaciens TaxID=358 RepID=A0A3S6IAG7_AGRTU|nr:hypothetical protein AgrTiEU6_160 [Agrobacterium tumefaciens]
MISDSCVTPIRVGLICPARQFADGGSSMKKVLVIAQALVLK